MASFIATLSELLGTYCARLPNAVLYGENINNGSRIVGMCRNLTAPEGGRILNVGDCEATHIGVGFGLMLNGVHSVLFAKQLDFMLLGVDQFVNTYNFIRCSRDHASLGAFTVVAVICDQGYQGPQSSFNALGDLCSLARVPGFTLTNAQDTPRVLEAELAKPGFRFICVSQRLFSTEILDPGFVWSAADYSVFQYSEGRDATIVCFNCSLPNGYLLRKKLCEAGMHASLFSANYVFPLDATRILDDVRKTGRLIVVDDSKSTNLAAHRLLHEFAVRHEGSRHLVIERGDGVEFSVCSDEMSLDCDKLVAQLSEEGAG